MVSRGGAPEEWEGTPSQLAQSDTHPNTCPHVIALLPHTNINADEETCADAEHLGTAREAKETENAGNSKSKRKVYVETEGDDDNNHTQQGQGHEEGEDDNNTQQEQEQGHEEGSPIWWQCKRPPKRRPTALCKRQRSCPVMSAEFRALLHGHPVQMTSSSSSPSPLPPVAVARGEMHVGTIITSAVPGPVVTQMELAREYEDSHDVDDHGEDGHGEDNHDEDDHDEDDHDAGHHCIKSKGAGATHATAASGLTAANSVAPSNVIKQLRGR